MTRIGIVPSATFFGPGLMRAINNSRPRKGSVITIQAVAGARWILRCCLIHLKNSSTCQRLL